MAEILLLMTTYTKFKEYIWLVNTIYHAKAITFADINRKWLRMTIKIVRNKNTEKKNNYAWSSHW